MVVSRAQEIRARTRTSLLREQQRRARTPRVITQQQQQQRQQEQQQQQRTQQFQREISTLEEEIRKVALQEEKLRKAQRTDAGLEQQGRSLRTQLQVLRRGLGEGRTLSVAKQISQAEARVQATVVAQQRGVGTAPIRQPQQVREQKARADGLELVFTPSGELVAVSDPILRQSRAISQFRPIISGGKVIAIEDLTLRQSRKLDTPIEVSVAPTSIKREIDISQIPLRTFTASETNIAQLTRNIKESIPELKFIPTKTLRTLVKGSIVTTGIPALVGTKRFAISKFKQGLANPTGAFQFRVDQAEAIGNLADEIVTGFVAGKGVGKGITLIRGAGSQFIPTALKQSAKFKKTITALQVVGGITLTAGAGLSVKKAFEQGGTDAGVLALIGLTSFGVGFGTTGIKSSAQAQKEFQETADLFKQLIPKGKKGEARFDELGKFFRKKKSPFAKLEQLDRKAVQEASNKLASIEKKIANAKSIKEQLKILAEIKKKLKTKQAKENFNIFVKGLIEKEILRPVRFKVKEGIFVSGVKVPKIPFVVTGRAKTRNQQRTSKNQKRNQKRINRSKLPLAVRFKEAQQLSSRQRQDSKLKQSQKTRTQTKQRLSQATRTSQALRTRQIQTQRQTSKQALKNLFKSSFRVGAPVPFGLPKKKKLKKVKFLKFDLKDEAFDIFVRKRGKEKLIGSGLQENRAKKLLSKRLDNTLRASGRIVGSRKKPKFKRDISTFNFPIGKFRRPVKNSPLRKEGFNVVEKRKFRLDSPKERRNIQIQRKEIKLIKPFKKILNKTPKLRK